MNEEKIDDIIRKKLNNSIQVPNKIYNDVDKVLDSIKDQKVKHFKKNKILKIVATVLIVSMVGVTGYAALNNDILDKLHISKKDNQLEDVSCDIYEVVENEEAKIELRKLACDDSYLILEYNVEIKEKLLEEYKRIQGKKELNAHLENGVKIKNYHYDDIDLNFPDKMDQIVEKTSDNTFSIYQTVIIASENIPTKFKLNIEFQELCVGNSDEEHLIIGFGDYETETGIVNNETLETEKQHEANSEKVVQIQEVEEQATLIQELDEASLIQEIEEDPTLIQELDEVSLIQELNKKSELIVDENSEEDIIKENTYEKKGVEIEFEVDLEKARENTKVNVLNKELKLSENQNLKILEYIKTPITNFVKIELTNKNVNSMDIVQNTEKNPLNIILDVQDLNGNSLSYSTLKGVSYLKVKEGEDNPLDGEILEIDDSLDFKGATIKSEYIFALNDLPDDISKIKIVPLLITDEEENNDNTKWYPLKDGKYSFKNNVGGEIKVNEIKVNDNKLLFYYDKVGCMPQQDAELIIRANEEKYGYNRVFTSIYEKNSKIKNSYISGVDFNSIAYNHIADERIDLENIIKNDIDNVEFSFRITSKINVLDEKGIEIDVK